MNPAQHLANITQAAPDLLAALEQALEAIEYMDEREGCPDLLKTARAAIAKARRPNR